MSYLDIAEPFIERHEGFRPRPYLCPAEKWTIGFGTTRYPDGRKVGPHDLAISQDQGRYFMRASLARVAAELAPLIHVRLTDNQRAALVDLAYNVGVGCHDGHKGDLADSTLLARLNAGDVHGAADQFMVWDKAHVNGHITAVSGLTARRHEDRNLFLRP